MLKLMVMIAGMVFITGTEDVKNDMEGERMKNIYKYKLLKSGEIIPDGWIMEQLKRDLTDGYVGSYDEVSSTVTYDVFINQDRRSKRNLKFRKEWWNGEHEGYWKDAVIRMAFLTNNEQYIDETHEWIGEIKEITKTASYLGIYEDCNLPGCRFNHKSGNGELWTTSRLLMALLAYYEFTDDKEVLQIVERATKLIMQHYKDKNYFEINSRGGGVSHGIGFFENLEWLYRMTGDEAYLEFSAKLYNDFNNGNVRDDDLKTKKLLERKELFEKHGAHIAEGLYVPEYIAAIDDNSELDTAAKNVLFKLQQHLTPGGAMRCDEWIKGRKGTADERYEYCGMAEMISPLNKIITFSANLWLADLIETMTFNAAQGSRFPVLKGLSYLTSDNRKKINHREIAKRESYDAAHLAAACCALNGGRLMPYYVEGMWMKSVDEKAIVAMLFGPSQVKTSMNGTFVSIEEQTNYPFSDTITFKINPEEPHQFDLIIRKPHGCQLIDVDVSSEAEIEEMIDMIRVHKKWKKGDEVRVHFNFEINHVLQPPSKTVKNEGVYLKRGPLVYALPFKHQAKTVKEYKNSGFYRYKIKLRDTTDWRLRLDINDNFHFEADEGGDFVHPWDEPVVFLEGKLRDRKNNKINVKLVPMGNTIFRRVTFSRNIHKN